MKTIVLQNTPFLLFPYKNENIIPKKMISWEDDDDDEEFENIDDFDEEFDIEEIDESELGDDFKKEFKEIYTNDDFIEEEDEEEEDEEIENEDF